MNGRASFSKDRPGICVPVSGRNASELALSIERAAGHSPDLLEWRFDGLEHQDAAAVKACSNLFKELAQGIYTVFTCRTSLEGGAGDPEDYGAVCLAAAGAGAFDAIDVEAHRDPETVKEIVEHAHALGMDVIASWHDFSGTPSTDELVENALLADRAGGDILKLAVMPDGADDVKVLKEAADRIQRLTDKRLIIIAMGEAGRVTRVSPREFGSCITFASAGKASAPGQIEIDELRRIMNGA